MVITEQKKQAAINSTTVAAKANTIAMKAMAVAGNMVVVWLISEALSLAVKGINNMVHASENAREELKEAAKESSEITSSHNETKKALDDLIDQYTELKSLGMLNAEQTNSIKNIQEDIVSLIGQQAEGMDLLNGKLEDQVEILKKERAELADENMADYVSAYQNAEKNSDAVFESKGDVDWVSEANFATGYTSDGQIANRETRKAILQYNNPSESLKAELEAAGEILKEAFGSSKIGYSYDALLQKDYEIRLPGVDAKSYIENIQQALDALENDETFDYTSSTIYADLSSLISSYKKYDKEQSTALHDLINNILDVEVYEAGTPGETPDDYLNYRNNIINSAFNNENLTYAKEEGLTKEGLTNYIDSYLQTLYPDIFSSDGSIITPNNSLSLDTLKTTSSSISSIKQAFSEVSDGGYITIGTISNIKEAVGSSIPNWDEYEKKLLSVKKGSSEYAQIMSDLTYATLENKLGTNELAHADEEYITAILRENGILNANAVAKEMIKTANAKMAIQNKIATEITTESSKINLENMQTEAAACNLSKQAYAALLIQEIAFNNNTLNASQKISQIEAITASLLGASEATSLLQGDLASIANGSGKDKESYAKSNGIKVIKDTGNYLKNGKKDWQYEVNGVRYETISEAAVAQATYNAQKTTGTYTTTAIQFDDSQTKESFNWIETALSRIQRTISNLGKTVSATYKSWGERNSTLAQQMSNVSHEIDLQNQAYDT